MRENHLPIQAARPSDLKLNNRIQILELFKSGAVRSIAEIANEIGISRQTVMKSVQFYLEKGIIVSEGKAASGRMGGKRAELFRISGDQNLFSVLICPDYLHISLFNFRCEVKDTFLQADIAQMGVDEIIEAAGRACAEMMKANRVTTESVRGVCVNVPGIVDRQSGRLRYNSLFPSWGKQVPIVEKIAEFFQPDTLIMMENVAKACGSAFLQKARRGCFGRGATVFSSWGGISACLIQDGSIVDGKDSLIGEIGHMMIAPEDDELCGCGCRGCFERQVSPSRTRRVMEEYRNQYPESRLFDGELAAVSIGRVFEASRAGDALAQMLSRRAATYFAQALRNLTLIFNPDWVVFQGDYAGADEIFRETLYRELRTFNYYVEADGEKSPFELKMDDRDISDLSTRGAYTLLLDRLFRDQANYL